MRLFAILLGAFTLINSASAAFSFGDGAGGAYEDNPRYVNPYNNNRLGEGNAIDLSCACAQRILNKQEKLDYRCYNFVQGFDRAMTTPNSLTPLQAPATAPQHRII